MATLLWSSNQKPSGIAICPYCSSVTGFEEKDLQNSKVLHRVVRGRRAIKGIRGMLKCENPDCQKQFEAECK